MKYCTNCGFQLNDEDRFCPKCGHMQPVINTSQMNDDTNANETDSESAYAEHRVEPEQTIYESKQTPKGEHRNIALCILFSIITFGIYGIYWKVKLNDEMAQTAGETDYTSGLMVLVYDIITLGIYSFFWAWKMGKRTDIVSRKENHTNIIYLIMSLFGINLIMKALMQDAINDSLK